MSNFKWLKECLCCNSSNLDVYLLGTQPLANSYHQLDEQLEAFPLQVQVCKNCYHSQLTAAVNPDLLYKHYLYVSGTTETLREYFRWFVKKVENDLSGEKKTFSVNRVLDIASNDGTLLKTFKDSGWKVQGVDPAENLSEFSEKNRVPTLVDYWGKAAAKKLNSKYDVIVAQNVLAHLPYPQEFLQACKSVLAEQGSIYIQTSQADMIVRNEFDTIYHEHHSFFSAKSMKTLANSMQLYVKDVFKVPIHGTSYVFVLSHEQSEELAINDLIAQETAEGRYDGSTYFKFAENAKNITEALASTVDNFRSKGVEVVGFGAAAKGMTLLNFGKIKLDYIVDDNPLKWELLTPGMNIPIKNPDALTNQKENVVSSKRFAEK
jgi:2-polyprenyl-3-methyl-5-hydroxy-6-metoxy-1,4-benzoquinol methylase